jgi:hypothetical protein
MRSFDCHTEGYGLVEKVWKCSIQIVATTRADFLSLGKVGRDLERVTWLPPLWRALNAGLSFVHHRNYAPGTTHPRDVQEHPKHLCVPFRRVTCCVGQYRFGGMGDFISGD